MINLKGLTPGMLVTLGEQKILKLEDFADLASDELTGGFDIIKGEKKEISTAPGSYSAAGFSNDNKGFYYITDVGKEFAYLNKYDIKTSESTVVFETNWADL